MGTIIVVKSKNITIKQYVERKREERKRREELREVHLESRNLPEYLRKDLGLPPYDSYDKHDH